MKHEPTPAIHMEKSTLTVWVGPQVGWDRVSGDLQSGENSVNEVDRVSDLNPPAGSVALCGASLEKGQWPLSNFLSV